MPKTPRWQVAVLFLFFSLIAGPSFWIATQISSSNHVILETLIMTLALNGAMYGIMKLAEYDTGEKIF